jgi:hypothetical protein
MIRTFVIGFLLGMCGPASAQVAQPEQSPQVQAMSAELLQQIGAKLVCSGNLIAVQKELAAAQAQIKTLTPPPAEPAK